MAEETDLSELNHTGDKGQLLAFEAHVGHP